MLGRRHRPNPSVPASLHDSVQMKGSWYITLPQSPTFAWHGVQNAHRPLPLPQLVLL